MKLDSKLVICAVGSVIAHVAIARALATLPRHEDKMPPHKIEIRVVPAPPIEPPPEPEKPPEPLPPPPKDQPLDPPKKLVHAPTVAPVARDTPPPEHEALTTNTSDTPVFGVTMESTSSSGGVAMPVGNTTKAQPGPGTAAPAAQKALATPVAAFEATKLPLPQGRCFGKYTDEARAAGLEGTVVLDLIVGEDGHVRDIQVVSGLAHGLTATALAAIRDCTFTPGEKDGKAVAVRIRGFKVTYVLPDSN